MLLIGFYFSLRFWARVGFALQVRLLSISVDAYVLELVTLFGVSSTKSCLKLAICSVWASQVPPAFEQTDLTLASASSILASF